MNVMHSFLLPLPDLKTLPSVRPPQPPAGPCPCTCRRLAAASRSCREPGKVADLPASQPFQGNTQRRENLPAPRSYRSRSLPKPNRTRTDPLLPPAPTAQPPDPPPRGLEGSSPAAGARRGSSPPVPVPVAPLWVRVGAWERPRWVPPAVGTAQPFPTGEGTRGFSAFALWGLFSSSL